MSNNQKNERVYFNLHTTGAGYVKRPRKVTPENGDAFYALGISALRGHSEQEKKTYTNFELNIAGKEAKEIIAKHLDTMQAKGVEVFISFVLGDIQPKIYTKEDKTHGCCIYGRLLQIKYLKIDGEVVFQRDKNTETVEAETIVIEEKSEKVEVKTEINNFYIDQETGEMLEDIKLDPLADDFADKKAELKNLGYKWNKDKQVWSLAQSA